MASLDGWNPRRRTAVSASVKRFEPVVIVVFVAGALLWGFGVASFADAAQWNPVVAASSMVVPVALFGWLRRGREILDVAAPAFAVAYAAYVGLAIVRIAQLDGAPAHMRIDVLDHRWPPILMAGIAFALILTVCAGVPASLIPRRRRAGQIDTDGNARFWAFVEEHNAANGAPKR
jgi:hypothetical protein